MRHEKCGPVEWIPEHRPVALSGGNLSIGRCAEHGATKSVMPTSHSLPRSALLLVTQRPQIRRQWIAVARGG